MRFTGENDNYVQFPKLTTIRTVFWVIKEDADASADQPRFLLGDAGGSTYNFHRDDSASREIWHSTHAPLMYDGVTELNGSVIDGRSTVMPTEMSILSVRTTANATANSLAYDRNIDGRTWDGDVAELIIFDRKLHQYEIDAINAYLADKYAIALTPKTASIWVQIPELTNSTSIFGYWGNTNATEIPVYCTNGAVWSENYVAVWHMSKRNGDISPDSTANGNDGTISDTNEIISTYGITGGGESFYDGAQKRITKTLTQSTWPEFSVMLWSRAYVTGQSTYTSIFNNNASANDFQIGAAATAYSYSGTIGTLSTDWAYIAMTCNSSEPFTRTYFNGGNRRDLSIEDATFGQIEVGCNRSRDSVFNGILDELHVSSVVRSDDWIKACYDNQSTPEAFASFEINNYYDADPAAGLQAGNGIWSTTNAYWNSAANGSKALHAFENGANAYFNTDGTSVITVDSVYAQTITFNGTGYTLSGGNIDLSQGTVANEDVSISSDINLLYDQTWSVAEGKTATVTGRFTDPAYITKTGPGELYLNNLNASKFLIDGMTIEEGVVNFRTGGWYQNPFEGTKTITINEGGTARISNAHAWGVENHYFHINGGTLELNQAQYIRSGSQMTGGLMAGSNALRMWGNKTLIVNAAPATAIISCNLESRGTTPNILNVADGEQDVDLLVQGQINNTAGITLNGPGTTEFTDANTYAGGTYINDGTLLVNNATGSGTGTGELSINGGTLSGTGTVANVVSFGDNGGTVAPGSPAGNLTCGTNVSFTATASATNTLVISIDGKTEGSYSQLIVETGTVTLDDAVLDIQLSSSILGGKFFIIVNNGPYSISGTFKDLPQGSQFTAGPEDDLYTIYYSANAETGSISGGNDVLLVSPVNGTLILIQ